MTAKSMHKPAVKNEPDDDSELQSELQLLVDRITANDTKLMSSALDLLKTSICTSTTSMTSVPKPLKYLAPYYKSLKEKYAELPKDNPQKKKLSDIISVLAMGAIAPECGRDEFDCLRYCIQGTMTDLGGWGHEYIRQLEGEIVKQVTICNKSIKVLIPLIKRIMIFNCAHNGELQTCDLLMETDQLHLLYNYITKDSYARTCLYLTSCARYVDDFEGKKIMKIIYDLYFRFEEHSKSLIVALQLNNSNLVKDLFRTCTDKATLYQMAFIVARHLYPFDTEDIDDEEIINIMNNNYLSTYFLGFARELDIMAPKSPEDIYKTWLEPTTLLRLNILGEKVDSARQNLASSFVNGFINAGFGSDSMLTVDGGNQWVYRNKEAGMMSTIASVGLLYLWDVDGGLTPIDKYLYTAEVNIKAGALLAIGIVNCRVKNDCDPAFALLCDYVNHSNETLQIGALLGIGLAYAGSGRKDVLDILLPVIQNYKSVKILGIGSLASGLVSLGRDNSEIADAVLSKIIELNGSEKLKSPFILLAGLGLALSYYSCKDTIDVPLTVIEVFDNPFKTILQTMLKMCAHAGSGNVLIVQELLRIIEEKLDVAQQGKQSNKEPSYEWNHSMGQAVAVLGVATICKGEEIGEEMIHRTFAHVARYGEPIVRNAVPLAIAFKSVSNPDLGVMDVLTKYSHDFDDDMSCNAIFGLGLIGAGTNNARLGVTLRQLAVYHKRNPMQLFMVRFSQGLIHMGKGTMTFNPLHTDRQLIDPVAMAGLLIPLVALIQPQTLILGRYHYLLYTLVAAMQPRWLLTLNENLKTEPVTVRVGQAVDIVGKAGAPKTIAGIHTHQTPVLLRTNERAELSTDSYEILVPTLDGICVLKKKSIDK